MHQMANAHQPLAARAGPKLGDGVRDPRISQVQPADDTPDELRALWVDTVHRSRDALAEALARGGLEQTTSDGMSLRRLVVDLIEEYARHTGHADLLREQVDRATGEGPPQDFPVP